MEEDKEQASIAAYLQDWLKHRENKIGAKDRGGKAVKQFLSWLVKRNDGNYHYFPYACHELDTTETEEWIVNIFDRPGKT